MLRQCREIDVCKVACRSNVLRSKGKGLGQYRDGVGRARQDIIKTVITERIGHDRAACARAEVGKRNDRIANARTVLIDHAA